MIVSLAFVPPENVAEAFDTLVENENFPPEAQEIANYFEDNYIGRRGRRHRRQPTFTIDLWNMYHRTMQNNYRTNNHVEGWHRHFQGICDDNPNIYKFISALKKEQTLNNFNINQLLAGAPAPAKNKKYAAVSQRLRTVAADYENRTTIDFLRGIAHNLSL